MPELTATTAAASSNSGNIGVSGVSGTEQQPEGISGQQHGPAVITTDSQLQAPPILLDIDAKNGGKILFGSIGRTIEWDPFRLTRNVPFHVAGRRR